MENKKSNKIINILIFLFFVVATIIFIVINNKQRAYTPVKTIIKPQTKGQIFDEKYKNMMKKINKQ